MTHSRQHELQIITVEPLTSNRYHFAIKLRQYMIITNELTVAKIERVG